MSEAGERLAAQLAFADEVDRLKAVDRRISLIGGARLENSAEHSWHLAVLAPVLAEYAPDGTNLARAQWMVLLHDVVEIDAGDAFAFDPEAQAGQVECEWTPKLWPVVVETLEEVGLGEAVPAAEEGA